MCYAAIKAQAQKNDLAGLGFNIKVLTNVFDGPTFPMGQMAFGYIDAAGEKICEEGQFGLLPDWVDDSRGGPAFAKKWKTYNARSETIFEKPSFREAIQRRRAVIPVQTFYEVADVGGQNFKFQVMRKNRETLYLGGIWEHSARYKMNSCAIITTGPLDLVKDIHSRSPLILGQAQVEAWLDPAMRQKAEIERFFKVADSTDLIYEK